MPVESSAVLADGVVIYHPELVNLYGCRIGDGTRIGSFVEVQKNATIGARCKISSHTFVCEGVTVEDEVFVGHGVMFVNDIYPRAANEDGTLKGDRDWELCRTLVRRGAAIGSNATVLPNLTIGEYSLIGAGAVVRQDVPAYAIVTGVPARIVGDTRKKR